MGPRRSAYKPKTRKLASYYGSVYAVCSNCKDFFYYHFLHYGNDQLRRKCTGTDHQVAARMNACLLAGMRPEKVCAGWAGRRTGDPQAAKVVSGPVRPVFGVRGCYVCSSVFAKPQISASLQDVLVGHEIDLAQLAACAAEARKARLRSARTYRIWAHVDDKDDHDQLETEDSADACDVSQESDAGPEDASPVDVPDSVLPEDVKDDKDDSCECLGLEDEYARFMSSMV